MRNEFSPRVGDVNSLSREERAVLENKVIPTAQRWVYEYQKGTPLYEHGINTLKHWQRLPAGYGGTGT